MLNRKFILSVISLLVVTSLLLAAAVQSTSAQVSAVGNLQIPLSGETPHYYGPYPNWANSPQVLADAIVTISAAAPAPGIVGNPLIDRGYATDQVTAPGVLAPVLVVLPNAVLPTGTLNNFKIWNQTIPGSSPTASEGGLFHAYVLRPTAVANEYTVVHDSGLQTVPAAVNPAGEIFTVPAPSVPVQAGDVLGFYGQGIPVDVGGGSDLLSYPATANPDLTTPAAPTQNDIISMGTNPGFPSYSQDRTYSFSATVTPAVVDPGTGAEATATVDPKTGAISAITVINPGSGYLVAPHVAITSPGITPTGLASATAVISAGVLTNITVIESGFGFSAPAVAITGGNPSPGFEATAVASGGVDFVTLTDPGTGYAIQPIVEFSLPNLAGGIQATATATMDVNGAVTAVDVINPGSGYTSAPTMTIWDGVLNQAPTLPAVQATAVASIGISQIDITSGGQGYDSLPTVTVTDLGGIDRGASATAAIAVRGAVTSINVTNPGAGYLTPGLKKFVDTLPGLGPTAANNLGQYIPVAVPDTTTYPGTDYYEIAVVQYRMKFHRDLPATLLRGYVQLSTNVVPGNQVPLSNANFNPAVADAPIAGYTGVDNPHYLGPTIVATKDRPVRILFRNLLPTGAGGSLFLPVDSTMMGAGPGPAMMTLDANGVPQEMFPNEGTAFDRIRNPICNEVPKPDGCFSENRATLHLHGGITPWISDGTPHQWTTPAGENTPYPQGVSVSNVPDMPDPGPGAMTFFYTNQQSARLLFYHDHAWGITRLNVYAGEAAGYLITDEIEQALIAPTGALAGLGVGTPLIIQDKTFVPSPAQMALQDPTWQSDRWGGEGSLWVPHVYMPAQNPSDPTGMSSFGRWMYGPFFWPPANAKYPPIANPYYDPACDPNVAPFCEPALIPGTPNVSVGMEAFNDTPIVNGTAYPTTTVEPKAYRYRILNAANDRFWNLSWYVADPRTGTLSEVALNPAELAAAQTDPVVVPTPDTTWSPKGPNWIQIGTEGGFLPAPVVLPAQPTTWITDPTRFDVGNVDQHSLLLAPAERADVIVDFSQFRGKTLILYNDAPAAFPARVPGYDYYTGGPDLSPSGAPTTLPGYGPNTRTIMQVKVSNTAPAIAFDRPNTTSDRMGALVTAFAHHADNSGVFEAGQNPIIVGQAAYNSAYGSNFAASGWCNSPTNPAARCDGYARISEQGGDLFGFNTLAAPNAKMEIPLQPKGIHDEMNSANFDEFGRMTANIGLEAPGATPLLQNIILYPFVNPVTEVLDASGLPSSLDVTPISVATDGTQIWKITHNGVDTHPIHFHLYDIQVINRVAWDNIISPPDPNELGWKDTVRINPLQDTYVAVRPIVPTLPFGVPDSVRPLNPMMPIGARGTQEGPNGLEAGFNNTGPTGLPVPPIINEMTNFYWEYVWHCHILSHEEMDMMRPVSVFVPRALPDAPVLTYSPGSVILNWSDGTPVNYLAPTTWVSTKNEIGYLIERATVTFGVAGPFMPIAMGAANTTTYTDIPPDPAITYDYRVTAWNAAGDSPSNVVRVPGMLVVSTTVVDSSLNPSSVGQSLTFTATVSPAAASGTVTFNIDGFDVGTPQAVTSGIATYATSTLTAGSHIVIATYNGDTAYLPSMGTLTQTVNKLATTTSVAGSLNPSIEGQSMTFTATVSPAAASGTVTFNIDGIDIASPSLVNGQATYTVPSMTAGTHPVIVTYNGDAAYLPSTSATLTQTVNGALPAAPSNLVASPVSSTQINLTWTDNAVNETGFTIQRATNPNFINGLNTITLNAANQTAYINTGRQPNTTYYYRVRTFNAFGFSAWSNLASAFTAVPGSPVAPSNLIATAFSPTQINLAWTDTAVNETGFTIQRATSPDFNGGRATITLIGANLISYNNTGRAPNTTYYYRVRAFNAAGLSDWSNTVSATTPPAIGAVPTGLTVAPSSRTSLVISWTYISNGAPGPIMFDVQRSSTGLGGWATVANDITPTTFTNSGRTPNTTYYYRVRSVTIAGNSAWTNVVSGTTLP